jgi:serine/threonine protein phosphatase PrpC
MSSTRYEKSEFLAYAFYGIAARSNEDRYASAMDHSDHGAQSLASFGIFDGHMGVRIRVKVRVRGSMSQLIKMSALHHDTDSFNIFIIPFDCS